MPKKILYPLYMAVLLVAIVVFALFLPGPLKQNTLIEINKGDTPYSIAKNLADQNIIRNRYFLAYLMRVLGLDKKLVIGEFEIQAHQNVAEIISAITDSKKLYFRKITIPEGFTVPQINEVLLSNPYLTGGIVENMQEGSLMPDTYYFTKGETRADIINRMHNAMTDYINSEWPTRETNLPFYTKDDAITLASLIEKETANPSERFLIAGVFVNRLKLGMPLQSDPTVAYGLHINDATKLTLHDLQIKTEYNTYTRRGLPVGPIANPGRAAIYAALHPAQTNYLYFVADGNGSHMFAATLSEHHKNVLLWRKIEAEEKKHTAKR